MSSKAALKEAKAHAKRYLRRHEAASYLNVSHSYLAKLAVFGGGPRMIRAGRTILYDRDDLDEWLAARKVTSTSEVINVA